MTRAYGARDPNLCRGSTRQAETGRRTTAACPVCGRTVKVSRMGQLYSHRPPAGARPAADSRGETP